MSWNIVYTEQAGKDLWDIYEYIASELLVPETAAGQIRRIMQAIQKEGDQMEVMAQGFDNDKIMDCIETTEGKKRKLG